MHHIIRSFISVSKIERIMNKIGRYFSTIYYKKREIERKVLLFFFTTVTEYAIIFLCKKPKKGEKGTNYDSL